MTNSFFNNHPMLGSMFDFDRDGSLDCSEAMFMGIIGGAIIDEEEQASRKTARDNGIWDDDDWETEEDDW